MSKNTDGLTPPEYRDRSGREIFIDMDVKPDGKADVTINTFTPASTANVPAGVTTEHHEGVVRIEPEPVTGSPVPTVTYWDGPSDKGYWIIPDEPHRKPVWVPNEGSADGTH